MIERPILFSAPMVRAILEGRKTQTRRIVKPQPSVGEWHYDEVHGALLRHDAEGIIHCRHGVESDQLLVRETFCTCYLGHESYQIIYAADRARRDFSIAAGSADDQLDWLERSMNVHGESGRPGIHMPRWASRITLEVTQIRVERLQEISDDDAIAEGIERVGAGYQRWHPDPGDIKHEGFTMKPQLSYMGLWESINGPGSWDANPWVWVVEFQRIPQ